MKPWRIAPLALIALTLGPAVTHGADERLTGQLPEVDAFPTPMAAPLTRIALSLAGISALSAGLTFWSRRRRRAIGGTDSNIRILANRSLSSRHHVVLLDVGGHRLLVGTGADAITMLADLTEKEFFSRTLRQHLPEEKAESDSDFLDAIGKFEGLDA